MEKQIREVVKTLSASKQFRAALDFLKADHKNRVEEMKEMALVFGETGKEAQARSPMYHRKIAREGCLDCATDSLGNVFGHIYGPRGKDEEASVLLEAHLDTVFPEGTPLAIREEGKLIYCPGIGDDAGGLALNLSVLRAIRHAGLVPSLTLMVAGTAKEEGVGNFDGMRKLLSDHPGIKASISIDGGGNERICRQGVGVRRTEFLFRGPGGHSWTDYGLPMCMHAMCRAMSAVAAIELPANPKTTVNIGVIGGGSSAGAIAAEARVHVDMRSLDAVCLEKLAKDVHARVQSAVAMENSQRGGERFVTVEALPYADIPAANAPEDGLAVRTAVAASRALKLHPDLTPSASTNSNIPMSRGIPSLTLGYGGVSTAIHSLDESFDPTDAYLAAQKALLVVFALAGLEGVTQPLVA